MATKKLGNRKVGKLQYVRQIAALSRADLVVENFPPGFELINSSGKYAILGPDGWVYKRTTDEREGWAHSMELEAKHFQQLVDAGVSWAPVFSYYPDYNIVVMKRYNQEYPKDENYWIWRNEIEAVVTDSGSRNVGIDPDDGHIVLLDGGEADLRLGRLRALRKAG